MAIKKYRKELNREELLRAVLSSMTEIGQENDREHIILLIEKLLGKVLTAEWATLWFIDKKKNVFYSQISGEEKAITVPLKEGLLFKGYTEKEPFYSNYVVLDDKDFLPKVDNARDFEIGNMIVLPVVNEDNEVLAVCQAMTDKKHLQTFTKNDIALFLSIQNFIIKMLSMHQKTHVKKKTQNNAEKLESLITDIQKDYQIELLKGMSNSIKKIPNLIKKLRSGKKEKRSWSYLESAIQSIDLRLKIMNDVLDPHTTDKNTLNEVEVKPIQEFNLISSVFKDEIKEKNIYFQQFIDPNIPEKLLLDIEHIKEVLYILLNNALDAAPKNSILKCNIFLNHTKDAITFSVTDAGMQISEEEQIVLLDPQRNHSLTIPRKKGINICLHKCKILGSQLFIQSNQEETSFVFSISLNKTSSTLFYDRDALSIPIIISSGEPYTAQLIRYLEAFQIDKASISVLKPDELTEMKSARLIFCMTKDMNISMIQKLLDQGNIFVFLDSNKADILMDKLDGLMYKLDVIFSPIEIHELLLYKPVQINPLAKKLLLLDGYETLKAFIVKVIDSPDLEIESTNSVQEFLF